VVVFDDVTRLIAAQRSAAWGEVARRLAHEIKNPLTPIQLSAERLQMKLADRLSGVDARCSIARRRRSLRRCRR
jgi:nitrogen fixation/metabolism regulation signal transduction histidine kinase